MTRFLRSALVGGFACLGLLLAPRALAAGVAAEAGSGGGAERPDAGPAGKPPAGLESGVLQQVAKPLGKLLCLSWDKKGLKLDREVQNEAGKSKEELVKEMIDQQVKQGLTKEEAAIVAEAVAPGNDGWGANILFGQIRDVANAHASGSGGGGDNWDTHFQGAKLSGNMAITRKNFRLVLTERSRPGHQVDVQDDGEGRVVLVCSDADDNFFLRISQRKDGSVSLVHIRGKDVFLAQAESFAALLKAHRRPVENDLLPLLRFMGVTPPLMPGDPAVRAEVLAQLRPLGDEERKAFEELVRGLDANDFPAREAASKKLGESYTRFREPIEKLLKEGKLAPEAKNRLQAIVEAKGREAKRIDAAVAALGLLDDPGCLVEFLGDAQGPDAAAVVAQLRKLAGQDLPDAAAWKKWWEEKNKSAGGATQAK